MDSDLKGRDAAAYLDEPRAGRLNIQYAPDDGADAQHLSRKAGVNPHPHAGSAHEQHLAPLGIAVQEIFLDGLRAIHPIFSHGMNAELGHKGRQIQGPGRDAQQ